MVFSAVGAFFLGFRRSLSPPFFGPTAAISGMPTCRSLVSSPGGNSGSAFV